jgi:hypothetical protein
MGCLRILVTLFTLLLTGIMIVGAKPKDETECPVCYRVLRAVNDLGGKQGIPATEAFDRYCDIANLEVEDQKFCYNTANVRRELFRLMELGADEYRVCKKVKSMNPDFCLVKAAKPTNTGIHLNDRNKRGIIYI